MIFLLAPALAFLVIGGLLFFLVGSEEKKIQKERNLSETTEPEEILFPKEKEEFSEEKQGTEDQKALFQEALKARDLRKCQQIQEVSEKNKCHDSVFLALGIEKKSLNFCEEIFDRKKKRYCKDQVFFETARSKKDFSLCNQISQSSIKKRCLSEQAREISRNAENINDCSDIMDIKERNICWDRFAIQKISEEQYRKKSSCENLKTQKAREDCLLRTALVSSEKEGNTQACRELEDEKQQKKCLQGILKKFQEEESQEFIKAGDVESCAKLSDKTVRENCEKRSIIARAIEKASPHLCEQIKEAQQKIYCLQKAKQAANAFYYQKAKQEKNADWCESIYDDRIKKSCERAASEI